MTSTLMRIRRRDIWVMPFTALVGCRDARPSIAGIYFEMKKNGDSPLRLVFIHGDENTARDVTSHAISRNQGLAFLIDSSTREVPVIRLKIDPNRMFSREGAEANLRDLNPGAEESDIKRAIALLDRDREEFLQKLLPPPGGLIIALHNNSKGYSIEDEIPLSDRYQINQPDSRHNFFLTSSLQDFDIMEKSPFNSVLQQNPPPPDDGSLSRLCAKRSVRYINIEAALGNYTGQQSMLNWILKNIPIRI